MGYSNGYMGGARIRVYPMRKIEVDPENETVG